MSDPGWHQDPYHRHEQRYFDGSRWTEHVVDAGTQGLDDPAGTVIAPPRPINRPPMSPHYRAPVSPAATVMPKAPRSITGPAIITGIGSLLLIGGAFLPWVKVSALFATLEVSGVDDDQGDGWITLACGVVALVVLLFSNPKVRGAIALLAGGLAAWVGFADLIDVRNRIDELKSTANGVNVHAVVGMGLWATVAGAAALLIGSLLMLLEREQ